MGSSSTPNDSQKIDQDHVVRKGQKFEGFDFLRAFFSLAIVAYKTNVFHIPEILVSNAFTYALSAYIFSGIFGALAVPVFLQISLFLFYLKSEQTGLGYFIQKRLPRLICLYLFWVCSIALFDILFVGKLEAVSKMTSSPKAFLEFVISGNSTPYFFFFSLIFVTIVAEVLIILFSRIEKTSAKISISYCLLFASLVFVFASSIIEPILNYTGIQSSFLSSLNNIVGWDYTPSNFLPYVFTAAITVQEYKDGKLNEVTQSLKRKLYCLLALALGFFILEWTLTANRLLIQLDQALLNHYLRLSLVFGSWLLLYLGLLSKQKVPTIVGFLSACSLGIYGFHVFFTFRRSLSLRDIPFLGGLFQAVPTLEVVTIFLLVLAGSIALTLLFKKTKLLRRFV